MACGRHASKLVSLGTQDESARTHRFAMMARNRGVVRREGGSWGTGDREDQEAESETGRREGAGDEERAVDGW